MGLPDISALTSYGGALFDYSAVVDPTTDRPASGANPAYNDVAAMTATAWRAWARITLSPAGVTSATPVLVAHSSVWGNAIGVAPVLARTSPGLYTITWPTTVVDQIPNGLPGFVSSHTLNLRAGLVNVRGATIFHRQVDLTSANVATIRIAPATSGSVGDPGSATDVDVYVL